MPERGVRILPAAHRDLEAIYAFGLERFGIEQADRYLAQLRAAIEGLALFPTMGHVSSDEARDELEFVVRAHNVRYSTRRDPITNMRLYHQRAVRD